MRMLFDTGTGNQGKAMPVIAMLFRGRYGHYQPWMSWFFAAVIAVLLIAKLVERHDKKKRRDNPQPDKPSIPTSFYRRRNGKHRRRR